MTLTNRNSVMARERAASTSGNSWKVIGLLKSLFSGAADDFGCGANDIIVIAQNDGGYLSTPFHVQFPTGQKCENQCLPVQTLVNGLTTSVALETDSSSKAYFSDSMPKCDLFLREDELFFFFDDEEKSPRLSFYSNDSVDSESLSPTTTSPRSFRSSLEHLDTSISSLDIDVEVESATSLSSGSSMWNKSQWAHTDHIKALNLKRGKNEICFRTETTDLCSSVFLWDWSVQIVVVNVDGVNNNHLKLLQKIARNGYRLVYLSRTRCIKEVNQMREDIFGMGFPVGPVLFAPVAENIQALSTPSSILSFFNQALREITSLFPKNVCPLYAGFGVDHQDLTLLQQVGVPQGKRYLLNQQQEGQTGNSVTKPRNTAQFSFCVDISEIVDFAFPPSARQPLDFNSFNFWRTPIPEFL